MTTKSVVVITGGAHGIGAELARRLWRDGASVALLDADVAAAEQLARELGERAAAFHADVTSVDSLRAAADAVVDRFGGVDVLVANAGIAGPSATTTAVDPDAWEQVVQVNLLGPFRTAHVFAPHVVRRRGYVMVVASIAAVVPGPTIGAYTASKAGVESFARALRIELADKGVDVGIAYFGLIDTGLAASLLRESGLGVVMSALPSFVSRPAPVADAAGAIASGIARRAQRVYAPRWVQLLLDLRPLAFMADVLVSRMPQLRTAIRDADVPAHQSVRS